MSINEHTSVRKTLTLHTKPFNTSQNGYVWVWHLFRNYAIHEGNKQMDIALST